MKAIRQLSISGILLLASGPGVCPHAYADGPHASPLIAAGVGTENSASHSGTNLLLRVEAGIGTGGNPCNFSDAICMFRTSQMVWMHVEGEASVNSQTRGSNQLPYLNVRFTPVAFPLDVQTTQEVDESWLNRFGSDHSLQMVFAPTRVRKIKAFKESLSVEVEVLGVDWAIQKFPTQVIGAYVQAAVNLMGARIVHKAKDAAHYLPDGTEFSMGSAGGEAGLILALSETFVMRVTFGLDASLAIGRQGIATYDLDLYGKLSLSLSRLMEVNAQMNRSIENFSTNQGYFDTRVTSGLLLKFDWL